MDLNQLSLRSSTMQGIDNLGASNEVETATFLLSQYDVPQPDATIKCGAYSWKVHSKRFCDASPFFKAALDGSFQVGQDLS